MKKKIKKYKTFIYYTFSSGVCFFADQFLFYIFRILTTGLFGDNSIFLSAVIARAISSFLNYIINRNVVFNNKERKNTIYKYYALVIIQLCISTILVYTIYKAININDSIIKVFVDIMIFIVNYFVQKKYIFIKEVKVV